MKFAFPLKVKQLSGGKSVIQDEKQTLGITSYEERIVFTVFTLAALSWISRSFLLNQWIPGINDTIIALTAAGVLFMIPARSKQGEFLLDWNTAKNLPWGILILLGR